MKFSGDKIHVPPDGSHPSVADSPGIGTVPASYLYLYVVVNESPSSFGFFGRGVKRLCQLRMDAAPWSARADRCGALSRRPRSGGGLPMGAGGVLRDGCRGVGPDVARSSRRSTSGSLFGPVSSRRGGGMFQELCGDCCAGFVGPCGGCSPVAVPRRRRFALLRHVPQTGIPSFAVRSHGPPHLPIASP